MERILIIEDDEQNNQMIREYLENHGYFCTQAYSGSEGKLLFSMEKYDLVLLDLMLPGIPGEELVSEFSAGVPVIVLSAKSGLDSKVDVLSAGAEDYICKPLICRSFWCGYRYAYAAGTVGGKNRKIYRDSRNMRGVCIHTVHGL